MSIFNKDIEAKSVEIQGHRLICPVCSSKTFYSRKALLNTSAATFFGLDWANRAATCFVCSECTHISWFLRQ